MSVYRNLLRHTATYSVAVVISRLASFILLPVYTHYLDPTAYGLLEVLEVVNNVFMCLAGGYLGSALAYFYARAGSDEERLETAHTAMLGAHAIGLAACVAGWLAGPLLSNLIFQTPQYAMHCRVTIINVALGFTQEMGLAQLRAQNRSALYTRILTARLLLVVAINVTLLSVFHLGALAMLLGTGASTAAVTVYFDIRNLVGVRWRFRAALLKQQLRYAYPLGLSALGMTFIHSGDRFFLQRHVSLFEVGLYGIAYRFGTLAGYAQPIFETYWSAQVFNVLKERSGEHHYTRVMTYFALTLGLSAVVVCLFGGPMARVMTPERYHDAMALCPLIAICYAYRAIGDYFRNAFAVHQKTERNIVVTLAGVALAFVSYSVLIPWLRLWGAALATAVTFAGMSVVSYVEAQKVRRYAFEWRRLWTIAICALAVILPYPWVGRLRIVNQFLAAGVLTLLFPVLLWFARFFEAEELRAAREFLGDRRRALAGKRRAAVS